MTTFEPEAVIISALVHGGRDRMLRVLRSLTGEHFVDRTDETVFRLVADYFMNYGEVPTVAAVRHSLEKRGLPPATVQRVEEKLLFRDDDPPSEDEFSYAVDAMVDARAQADTRTVITTGMRLLDGGADAEDGVRPHEAARRYLSAELAAIDRTARRGSAPQGFIEDDKEEMFQRYLDARDSGGASGVTTGIAELDDVTGGFRNGELVLVCGTAAAGKSMFVTQLAWWAKMQNRHVIYFTVENVRSQVETRLIARHSVHVGGGKAGLNTTSIRDGRLSKAEEELLDRTIADLTSVKGGKLYLSQLPHATTIDLVEAEVRWLEGVSPVDLVIIDYLALLKPSRQRGSKREELSDILQEAKLMAVTLGGGRGVPVVSPWQFNRSGHKEALRTGEYFFDALAETSEAERTADQVLSLLKLDPDPGVRLSVMKNRDGAMPADAIPLAVDFGSCLFKPPNEDLSIEALLGDV